MKNIFIIILTIIFVIVVNVPHNKAAMTIEQIHNMMKPVGDSCASKVGISPELLQAHKNREFPEDKTLKCYLHCLARKGRILDKNDKVDLETTFKQVRVVLPENLVDRAIDAYNYCAAQLTSEEPCELSYQFSKCYAEKDEELYFFP